MNTSSKSVLVVVTVLLLVSSSEVECRRTYSSRSSSSGRGNRGKNQPSSGGLFSSWLGGSKSSSSGSGSIAKPVPSSPKKNWQTASSHATSQSKPTSNWANPYYKPSSSAQVPSAPKEANYGWKATNTQPATAFQSSNIKPASSLPSSNIGPRGYPVQTGVQQSQYGGYKPAASNVPHTNYQPSQANFGAYNPASNTRPTGFHPSGQQASYGGYHPSGQQASYGGYHPPSQPSHAYQPSHGYQPSYHQPSYHPSGATHTGGYHPPTGYSGYHSSHSGYSPHTSFGGAVPSYQGSKLFGGSSGHYGYPGSGSWGIDTYGAKKSSGTGKLLTGLAVGAAGGYLTSSLVNRISNPWKYSGYGYGTGFGYGGGYGSSYDFARSRDESAFERGFERGVQSRQQNENNNNNNNNKEAAAPPPPEDPTSKWVQCVAFDPQTQQTLINPNCSCTVTTSVDERTGQPLSVHHCTTLNGLVMKPIPLQPPEGAGLPPGPVNGQPLAPLNNPQPASPYGGGNSQPGGVNTPEAAPSYGGVYPGSFNYAGGPTIYLPPLNEAKVERTTSEAKLEESPKEAMLDRATTERKAEQSTTGSSLEGTTGTVAASEKITNAEPTEGGMNGGASSASEKLSGGLQENHRRTAEFYGQLQKIVNMGNFVDGG